MLNWDLFNLQTVANRTADCSIPCTVRSSRPKSSNQVTKVLTKDEVKFYGTKSYQITICRALLFSKCTKTFDLTSFFIVEWQPN